MNRLRTILVIVDPTASEHPAVAKGALLAERFDIIKTPSFAELLPF